MNKIFSVIAAATLAVASILSSAQAKPIEHMTTPVSRWIIRDDGGGNVAQFQQALKYLSDKKMALKVDGYCASACTLVLNEEYKLDVCVTKKVRFGFHQPYARDQMGKIHYTIPFVVSAEEIWTKEFMAKYPKWIQEVIQEAGGVPSVYRGAAPTEVLWLPYDRLKDFMRTCID